MDQVRELSEVVGVNARRIRQDAGTTLNDVARLARQNGLKWSTGKVGDLEAGRISPSFPTLFALACTLGSVTGSPVSLRDLLGADCFIRINDDLVVRAENVAEAVSTRPVDLALKDVRGAVEEAQDFLRKFGAALHELPDYPGVKVRLVRDISHKSGETEERVAKSLGIPLFQLQWESAALWQDSFSAERDRRAGPNANAQKRGRASRELKAELRASINRGRD